MSQVPGPLKAALVVARTLSSCLTFGQLVPSFLCCISLDYFCSLKSPIPNSPQAQKPDCKPDGNI